MSTAQIQVAVLGARSLLGQYLLQRLDRHTAFTVTALADFDTAGGRSYGEAVTWRHPRPMPRDLRTLPLHRSDDALSCDLVLSLLPDGQAEASERSLARRGHTVVTHAEDLRLAEDVPLILPGVNGEAAVRDDAARDRGRAGGEPEGGRIYATPNCTTVLLGLPLKALDQAFGIEAVTVTALQAVSGADLPGLPWFSIHDTLMTSLRGEEAALESETGRLFGAAFPISVQAVRVPVTRGHALAVSVALRKKATPDEAQAALDAYGTDPPVQHCDSPSRPIKVVARPPAGWRDSLDHGTGDTILVSALSRCPVADLRFVVSGDNLHRGVVTTMLSVAELLAPTGIKFPT